MLRLKAFAKSPGLWNTSLCYTMTNLAAKSMAALSQLYAVISFSGVYPAAQASIVLVLLGYAIWIQILEFGLAQTLQNKLNRREISLTESYFVVLLHYAAMLLFSAIVVLNPEICKPLISNEQYSSGEWGLSAFSVGMALMVVATNNVIIQRILIVANLGLKANRLLLTQAISAVVSLAVYQGFGGGDLLMSVLAYLSPSVLVYVPLVIKLIKKVVMRFGSVSLRKQSFSGDAAGFWGLNVLSSIFLGADYYFVAHYLSNEEIVSYHFTTRFFFFSYVAYFSYIQHSAKNLTINALYKETEHVKKIMTRSIAVGLVSVGLVSASVLAFDLSGGFSLIIERPLIVPSLLMAATLYFLLRVFRDTGLVLLWNLGVKPLLYKVYLLEVLLGFGLLLLFSDSYAGIGIFLAMSLTVFASTLIVFYTINRMMVSPHRA